MTRSPIITNSFGGNEESTLAVARPARTNPNGAGLDTFGTAISDCGSDAPDCHRFVAGKSLSFHEAHNGS